MTIYPYFGYHQKEQEGPLLRTKRTPNHFFSLLNCRSIRQRASWADESRAGDCWGDLQAGDSRVGD